MQGQQREREWEEVCQGMWVCVAVAARQLRGFDREGGCTAAGAVAAVVQGLSGVFEVAYYVSMQLFNRKAKSILAVLLS
jgi:hypothetical protein